MLARVDPISFRIPAMTESRRLHTVLCRVLSAFLWSMCFATPALAATLTVNPLLPGAFSTIQAAVDASAAGDTILIRDKGTPYTEDVRIVGKQDLTVVGDRRVVLQTGGGPAADGILRVENSRRIILKSLQIFCDDRTARLGFVLVNVVDVVLEASSAEVCGAGVTVMPPATHTLIRQCVFQDDAIGVDVLGGSDAGIEGSKAYRCDTGVRSAGNGTRVLGLHVEDSGADGVSCTGGSNLRVEGGGFFGNSFAGVALRNACRSATVRNAVLNCKPISQPPRFPDPPLPNGFSGISVLNSGVYAFTRNLVSGCSGIGIALMPDPNMLNAPSGGYVGFNSVSGCTQHGFQVDAAWDGWLLEGNTAMANKGNGFLVNSSRNILVRNIALGNSAGGFALGQASQVNARDAINPADNVGVDNQSDGLIPLDLQ